jgi:16S rRNA (guanine(966)-N(2))-methyltransferase RsmD
MTDKLKMSLFNILTPYGIEGARVLDLYAGTGSLGIEFLSRGAQSADFVEQNAQVCRVIQDNLNTTKLSEHAHIHQMPVARFLSWKGSRALDSASQYDIIVLDPPYADPAIPDTLEALALSPILAPDGLVVIGHANRVKLADEYGGGRMRRVRLRAMGDSAFSIYREGVSAPEQPEEADSGQD